MRVQTGMLMTKMTRKQLILTILYRLEKLMMKD